VAISTISIIPIACGAYPALACVAPPRVAFRLHIACLKRLASGCRSPAFCNHFGIAGISRMPPCCNHWRGGLLSFTLPQTNIPAMANRWPLGRLFDIRSGPWPAIHCVRFAISFTGCGLGGGIIIGLKSRRSALKLFSENNGERARLVIRHAREKQPQWSRGGIGAGAWKLSNNALLKHHPACSRRHWRPADTRFTTFRLGGNQNAPAASYRRRNVYSFTLGKSLRLHSVTRRPVTAATARGPAAGGLRYRPSSLYLFRSRNR